MGSPGESRGVSGGGESITLSLSISLRVEGSTWVCLYPDHGIELLHESRHKLGALITHNFVQDSMVMEHLVPENLCCAESSEVDPNPFNQCLLHELVNNDKDHIVSTGEGRGPMISHEITDQGPSG